MEIEQPQIDLSQPLIGQLHLLNEEEIENPKNGLSDSVIIFNNKVVDDSLKSYWKVNVFLSLMFLGISAYMAKNLNLINLNLHLLFILGGIFTWWIFEYLVHRFLFHGPLKKKYLFKDFIFLFHQIHHLTPSDEHRKGYNTFIWCLFLAFITITSYLLDIYTSFGVFLYFQFGFVVGYTFYECIHSMIHSSNRTFEFPYFVYLRKRHLFHHHLNKEENFGVSTPLLDFLFRTNSIQ